MKSRFSWAFLLLLTAPAAAQDLPPEVAAVQAHMLNKDYPEVIDGKNYKVQAQNVVVADLDGDGRNEVVLHLKPHFRQSAPLLIYRVAPDMTVTRVTEGLAPGPLVPLNGEYLDSHTSGNAVDATVPGQEKDPSLGLKLVNSALKSKMSVAHYRTFLHLDSRTGSYYVDMTGLAEEPKSPKDDDFQFSEVLEIAAGRAEGFGDRAVLAAWTEGRITLYRINAIPESGFLNKSVGIVSLPTGFSGFADGANTDLGYLDAAGTPHALTVTCDSAQPASCAPK
jgi:hypothetical protein